jgi:pSer/pThr/pTyr-binding forkhead associated (FHA) protein
MPKLSLRYQGQIIKEYPLSDERLSIGRRSDNQIQIDDPTVSSVHAVLSLQADPYLEGHYQVTVVDFNSTNGVFVNGQKVSQQKLRQGDVIRLGQHELIFDAEGQQPFVQTRVQL